MASGMTVTLRLNGDGTSFVTAMRQAGGEGEKTGKKIKDLLGGAGRRGAAPRG
jgi:hypothetical protein